MKNNKRSHLIPIGDTKIKKVTTKRGSYRKSLIEILKYYVKTNSYKIKFNFPDENVIHIDRIKAKELRGNKPLEFSKNEAEIVMDHNY
jgi:hypothetical protein